MGEQSVLHAWTSGAVKLRLARHPLPAGLVPEFFSTDASRWQPLVGEAAIGALAAELARLTHGAIDPHLPPLPGTDEFLNEEHA